MYIYSQLFCLSCAMWIAPKPPVHAMFTIATSFFTQFFYNSKPPINRLDSLAFGLDFLEIFKVQFKLILSGTCHIFRHLINCNFLNSSINSPHSVVPDLLV